MRLSGDDLKRYGAKLESVVEYVIIWLRHLLVPFYVIIPLITVPKIFYDCLFLLLGGNPEKGEVRLSTDVMQGLNALDAMMVANVFLLIPQGSYYVFTRLFPYDSRSKPRSMAHLSSGLLKEKTASSLVGISSVALIQYFIYLAKDPARFGLTPPQALAAQLVIHSLLIIGLLAYNHTNKADHQSHNDSQNDEEKKNAHAHP